MDDAVLLGDCLEVLSCFADGSFQLAYLDPPFNTGRRQRRRTLSTAADPEGDRTGFGGRRYRSRLLRESSYRDDFDDYLGFLEPRLREVRRVLADSGTVYFHIDYREAHYCKLLLDELFGRECFLNEIIWAYDYGARPKRRWPQKHDTILVYVKDPKRYFFDAEAVEREPYMAPGLVTAEKAARGKLPSDCYSDDTDVLTDRGWVNFADLSLEDAVASVSPVREIVYSRPQALQAYEYTGEMYSFRSKTVDLLVTPNHRMYVRPKHEHDYRFIEARAMTRPSPATYYSLINGLTWEGVNGDSFEVPSVHYERAYCAKPLPIFDLGDWCEFMGVYLSEGSTTFYRDRTEVTVSQRKGPHVERIAWLLEKLRVTAHYNGRGFIICNKQLASYLRQFGKAPEKFIPRQLLTLSHEHLLRLYEGLMRGDGSQRGNEHVYTTASSRLADDVQELMLKIGYNANIRLDRPRRSGRLPRYTVARRISLESTIWPSRHLEIVPYDGSVYCCTVEPYHTLIVRRNGKPAVCGNCWWHTIVSPTGKEKTGYPTQKPEGIVRRMVQASTRPGDRCLDPFCGSGTLGVVAAKLDRRYVLIDSSEEAIRVATDRLARIRAA